MPPAEGMGLPPKRSHCAGWSVGRARSLRGGWWPLKINTARGWKKHCGVRVETSQCFDQNVAVFRSKHRSVWSETPQCLRGNTAVFWKRCHRLLLDDVRTLTLIRCSCRWRLFHGGLRHDHTTKGGRSLRALQTLARRVNHPRLTHVVGHAVGLDSLRTAGTQRHTETTDVARIDGTPVGEVVGDGIDQTIDTVLHITTREGGLLGHLVAQVAKRDRAVADQHGIIQLGVHSGSLLHVLLLNQSELYRHKANGHRRIDHGDCPRPVVPIRGRR